MVLDGNQKKIISDIDEHFDESMIPLKRFSGELPVSHLRYWKGQRLMHVLTHRIRGRNLGGRVGNGRKEQPFQCRDQ